MKEYEQVLEVHRDYVDIHILLEGKERIGWKAIEDVNQLKQAYQKEGDCALYSDVPTTFVDLLPGQFAIVYPEDPHAPVIGEGTYLCHKSKLLNCIMEEQMLHKTEEKNALHP